MSFDSLAAFVEMGGHGFYVWLSYGVTWLFLLVLAGAPRGQRRKIISQLSQRMKREGLAKVRSTSEAQI